jgi:hypothetical protein
MISRYVYKNLPQVRTHRRWSEGDSAAASCECFGCEKETRWFGRALRHEAEKRANVRTDAPGKEGDEEKHGILEQQRGTCAGQPANSRYCSTWQGKREGNACTCAGRLHGYRRS